MDAQQAEALRNEKQQIREQAHANRREQPTRKRSANRSGRRFIELPEYAAAKTVMFYVDVRTEVRTRQSLPDALTHGKRIVVPYCVDGELELFHLEDMNELSIGMYKILEPKPELREVPAKRVDVAALDLVMVPGVALTAAATHGHGMGLLRQVAGTRSA